MSFRKFARHWNLDWCSLWDLVPHVFLLMDHFIHVKGQYWKYWTQEFRIHIYLHSSFYWWKSPTKKVAHSKKMATSPPWPVSYHLIAFECLQRLWCFEFTACNLFARELWPCNMCNVQCEIDCSKTVKIVAWVICSRMAELCTAQSCMANFILIHQTTVHCVVCYSYYNCAILTIIVLFCEMQRPSPPCCSLKIRQKPSSSIQQLFTFTF